MRIGVLIVDADSVQKSWTCAVECLFALYNILMDPEDFLLRSGVFRALTNRIVGSAQSAILAKYSLRVPHGAPLGTDTESPAAGFATRPIKLTTYQLRIPYLVIYRVWRLYGANHRVRVIVPLSWVALLPNDT